MSHGDEAGKVSITDATVKGDETTALRTSRQSCDREEPVKTSTIDSPHARLPLALDTSDEPWLPSDTSRKTMRSMIKALLPPIELGTFPEEVWDRLERQNAQVLSSHERKNLRDKVRLALADMHKVETVHRKPMTTAKGGQSYRYKAELQMCSPPFRGYDVFGRQISSSTEQLRRSTSQVDFTPIKSPPRASRTGLNAVRDNLHTYTAAKNNSGESNGQQHKYRFA